jgi:hypothetical protein
MQIDARRSPKPQTQARPGPGTLTGVDPKAETGVTQTLQSRKNWNRILGSGSVRASMNEVPITDVWGERESGASALIVSSSILIAI